MCLQFQWYKIPNGKSKSKSKGHKRTKRWRTNRREDTTQTPQNRKDTRQDQSCTAALLYPLHSHSHCFSLNVNSYPTLLLLYQRNTPYPTPAMAAPPSATAVLAAPLFTLIFLVLRVESTWCVARSDASDQALQAALDYACGFGADCAPILSDGLCYLPNTLLAHASYAYNSYYQRKGRAPGSCDFAGTANIARTDPSTLVFCNYLLIFRSTCLLEHSLIDERTYVLRLLVSR